MYIIHELEPKKNGYLAPAVGQNEIKIFSKLRYFKDQNGPKAGPHENKFYYFQIQK